MSERVFLDANIFIDLNDEKRDPNKISLGILNFLVKNNYMIFTSCDLITTIYYILSKIDKEKALSGVEQINKFCKIIDFSNKDVDATCKLMRENRDFKDLEDAMQYILALREGCDAIISNDKNFYSPDIPLFSSAEFLKKYIKSSY